MRNTDHIIAQGFIKTVKFSLAHYGFLGSLARFLLLKDELKKFVGEGASPADKRRRRELIKKFDRIQRSVACAHSPYQFLMVARFLFSLEVEGPIVECGSFQGGSTAKLSLLARQTGRRLYVCDTFSGLPEPRDGESTSFEGFPARFPTYRFAPGEYQGTLEEVKANVSRYGSIESCQFVPGLYDQTLPDLDVRPALVFIDVDFVSSARDCLKHLWPRLVPGGLWFTHEAIFPEYMQGVLDRKWWHEVLKECPPVVFGAGGGLSPIAASLAYFKKS